MLQRSTLNGKSENSSKSYAMAQRHHYRGKRPALLRSQFRSDFVEIVFIQCSSIVFIWDIYKIVLTKYIPAGIEENALCFKRFLTFYVF